MQTVLLSYAYSASYTQYNIGHYLLTIIQHPSYHITVCVNIIYAVVDSLCIINATTRISVTADMLATIQRDSHIM